jgi:hypothetical protein
MCCDVMSGRALEFELEELMHGKGEKKNAKNVGLLGPYVQTVFSKPSGSQFNGHLYVYVRRPPHNLRTLAKMSA